MGIPKRFRASGKCSSVTPAEIKFGPGLNVIYGGSNTGKSHIMRLVDYVLGAGRAPEPITEQARYDLVHLGIVLASGQEKTLVRALAGGNVRVFDGLRRDELTAKEGQSLSAKHGANSISMYLLADMDSAGKRLRTDAKGETKELSFRDFKTHILVDEAKVQSEESPIQGGQVMNRTRELSAFKYMLTGVDDSALDLAKPEKGFADKQAAQLELLDRQIEDVERNIEQNATDPDEIEGVDAALNQQISNQFRVQELTEATYQQLSHERAHIRARIEQAQDREQEINLLQARFALLLKHYDADIERLKGIIDAGHVYDAEPEAHCQVCGAPPESHDRTRTCEGDIPAIIEAATAELQEVRRRWVMLVATAMDLRTEKEQVQVEVPALQEKLRAISADIQREVPSVVTVRSETQALVARRIAIQGELELIRRRTALTKQREEIGVSPGYDATTLIAENQLDGAICGGNLIDPALRRTLDRLVVCPACIQSDLSNWGYAGSAAAGGRTAWLLKPIMTCVEHNLALEPVDTLRPPSTWKYCDFARRIQEYTEQIGHQLANATSMPASTLERYLYARLDGSIRECPTLAVRPTA